MALYTKKELAEKLEQNIISVLNELNPTPGNRFKKEAKAASKSLSKKWAKIQEDFEKKTTKKLKKQSKKLEKAPKKPREKKKV